MTESIVLTFLLNAIWQIPLIVMLTTAAAWIMRNGPASHRNLLWTVALIASLALPLASSLSMPAPTPDVVIVMNAPPLRTLPVVQADSTTAAQSTTLNIPTSKANLAYLAFAAIALFAIVRFLFAAVRAWAIKQSAQPAPVAFTEIFDRCSAALGTKATLLQSSRVGAPAVLHRCVILPQSLASESSEDVLTTAIGHELAHVVRRDFLLNIVSEIIAIPIAFHPLTWWILRQISRTREIACDELVTNELLSARVYAQSIVHLAADFSGLPRPSHSLGVFDGNVLEERIQRLLRGRKPDWRRARLALAASCTVLVIAGIVAAGLAVSARAQSPADEELRKAAVEMGQKRFDLAVQHYRTALQQDPNKQIIRLMLADALLQQNPQDPTLVESARQEFETILKSDPYNRKALQGLLFASVAAKDVNASRTFAVRLIEADSQDKGAYYALGTANWAIVYKAYMEAKQSIGGRVDEYFLTDANLRTSLRNQYGSMIDEGIQALAKAIELDPNYDAAMAYTNLLYRLKGGVAETQEESAHWIAVADEWVGKAIATKKRKPAGSGDGNMLMAPPPPPPPPPGEPSNQVAEASAPPAPRNQVESPMPFWQVVGPTPMAARQLYESLRLKMFPASMLILNQDRKVRVMVGPYASEAALAEAKQKLLQAGFQPLRTW